MNELRILIADDEPEARALILHYLNQSSGSFQILQAGDGRTALELLKQNKPEILFLDIKMPELDGIGVLEQRGASPLPAIIFTTAFDEFALPAFDYEAIDYLLKPFSKERFDKALTKSLRYIEGVRTAADRPWLEQVSIKKGSRTEWIAVEDVQYFRSQGPYVEVYTKSSMSLINTPLYELEASLDPSKFVRIHKSLIISFGFIKAIQSLPNGDFIAITNNEKELRGSRTFKSRLKKNFKL